MNPAAYNVQTITQGVTYDDGTTSGTSNYCPQSCSETTTTTTTTTSTTTTTTTSPFFENVGMRLYARDSTANDPVQFAVGNVSFVRSNGDLLPVAVNIVLNSKGNIFQL